MDTEILKESVIGKLAGVIDPETGVDVIHMRLVQDLEITEDGKATYIFRPSSPLCPIAVQLALGIIQAVRDVPGISGQSITVVDYVQADELNAILKTIVEE